ncbi:MAG: histidine kinase [Polaribacter sp.]|uniref:sensor histidine kinase n=1 Tax=Polaribacter sp. TaxID=1920175 RepID=UPI003BB18FB6
MLEGIRNFYDVNPLGIFSVFIIGFLIIILIQNIFFYRIYKDNAYLWYAIYASIIIVDQVIVNSSIYFRTVLNSSLPLPNSLHTSFEWLYNSAYLIFVTEFGGLSLFKSKTSKRIKNIVKYLAVVLLGFFIIDLFYDFYLVRRGFLFILVPALIILSIFIYYHLFRMKTAIKYYIIIGSLAFSIFSILALTSSLFGSSSSYSSWSYFYVGVFIENIFFSLGLAKKQSLILEERNESQQKLIEQYKENSALKNLLTERLEKEVETKTTEIVALNKLAEEERIKQLELAFEKEIAELKVSSLQSQMNPHFIFNSLNSIKLNIIKNNKENAVYYLNKFSKLIRKILTISREKEVSLQDEIDTLELYVSIENLRFKNQIEFLTHIDKSINLETIKIPPLILQPFVENAIWHGLSPKEGEKKLVLSITKTDPNYIEIAIEDNGIGRKKAQEFKAQKMLKRESIGLKLTEERLAVFSNHLKQKHQIIFEDLDVGTRVIVKLFID